MSEIWSWASKELAKRVAESCFVRAENGGTVILSSKLCKVCADTLSLKKTNKQLSFSLKKKSPGQMVSLENSTQCLKRNQCQ